MKTNSGNSTHREFAVDPKTFRAKATGIGQTQAASLVTGGSRAQRVIDSAPEHCRKAIPVAEGYPDPIPGEVLFTSGNRY